MKRSPPLFMLALCLAAAAVWLSLPGSEAKAQDGDDIPWLVGGVIDIQESPVVGARIALMADGGDEPVATTETQSDGRYALPVASLPGSEFVLQIERAHFETVDRTLAFEEAEVLRAGGTLRLEDTILERSIGPAFWIATLIFLIVLALIATGILHNTLAALLGASLLLAVNYLGRPLLDDLGIFGFEDALRYIDWNVIFLIMGMMIFIAIVEKTGIFQWLAYFAYRISGGRMWLLLPILMLITGIASAFLDNVTTMLLMTPITIQISLALGINPLALLIPEVMASNVVGVSTLVGTPTNILIGSAGQISFNDFLRNLTPGVLLAFVGLVVYCLLIYRSELARGEQASEVMLAKLAESARVTEPGDLLKAGIVGIGMLVLFIIGEHIHLLPAVTALIGATGVLVWIRPDMEEMIEAVDWSTLMFFISLFIVIGAVQEVGLISYIAGFIGHAVGDNLLLAMLAITWMSAVLSTVVANIPFTASMLPVIGFLTRTIPGASNQALYYCLSIGAAMGGNGSLIGASANMVTAGIADTAGYRISYAYFLKKGFPALLITVALSFIWLAIRFLT
ncbi:MAG: SLC13 family permease [Anaerolineales bacterium]|jgi:Na+/H+ antiporter NhaD/arsenite permease-like protein